MADDLYPIVRVSEWDLRRMFNEGRYWERCRSGELRASVRRNVHLTLDKAKEVDEPYCTHSQQISYLDEANLEVVRVHQYLRADGSVGAKGRPDPKRMLVNGTLYRIQRRTTKKNFVLRIVDRLVGWFRRTFRF